MTGPQLLVGDMFANSARAARDRPAAALGDRTITYGELDRRANQVAHALRARGIGHGDRVVVWSATSLDTLPVFVAVAKLGAVFAPIGAMLNADEAADMLVTARPALLAADGDRIDDATRIARAAGIDAVGTAGLGDDDDDDSPVAEPALRETDPHVLFFTSGSTGRPKGVVLSHRANMLRSHPGALGVTRGPTVCPFPLFHMGGWTIALQAWHARELVAFTSSDPVEICDALERHRAYRLHCIPGIWRRILEHLDTPAGRRRDLSSLRLTESATSATPIDLLLAIKSAIPSGEVRVFYGSTEAGTVTTLDPVDVARKPGSVGVPGPLAEIRLSEAGEILCRGPMLFDGYFEDPDATADALVDGWYHTGDLVDLDDEGYVSVVGRARDVIRTGGESVTPPEVELALADHPALADVAVVGLPDEQWGEVVCAVVVLAPGAEAPTVDHLRAHVGDRLARFKHPRRVAVVDEIPRPAATKQVQRRLLVEQLAP